MKDFEQKLNETKSELFNSEETVSKLKDDIHQYQTTIDDLEFSIKVKNEKEKINENCVKSLKDKIKEYEFIISDIEKENKEKEGDKGNVKSKNI